MFYAITGKIVLTDPTFVALECGGITYKCSVSMHTLRQLPQNGATVTLYTHLVFNQNATSKDDPLELYGFIDREELAFFKMLVSVSGVGAKAAISILSTSSPSVLALSITSGDVKAITKAQGVGPKIAQRVVLELKGKVAKLAPTEVSSAEVGGYEQTTILGNVSEAVSALAALGFSPVDAQKELAGMDPQTPVQTLIKEGLKKLSWGG